MDRVKIRRHVDTPAERDETVTAAELLRGIGTDTVYHPEASLTLTAKHQGKAIIFTNQCVVTVPADLPAGFSCGWAQGGAGAVTFVAGDGVGLRSLGGMVTSAGQYAPGGLARMADGDVWLYGALQ